MNAGDADAENFIRVFTILEKSEIDSLITGHQEAPHLRLLQKRLAEEVTVMVHSRADFEAAVEASTILFGKGTKDSLIKMDEDTFLSVFEGVPQFDLAAEKIESGIPVMDLLAVETQVFTSKGECRRLISGGGVSLNKEKIADVEQVIGTESLINNKYILAQKGKKNYFVITVK